ncbi:predicted protein [Chaetomium globosum CBS 148.51]|uniref:Uncharacterized protein n=1 Tax=Chaetomium globosum (strain ATCC 6205 / CBS 148.51 / DSM 1962 / NBRC 6347 / NRRL 1970) TaxID=306901 RepID=Q2H4M5_CHAGB|nr:uncharacterized protein CHGG_06390 [Chaetomium globosum CBS 148.51]EAQ89771.1 predicted protein [Chaetomium globosum CBS 148.51]
MLKPYPVDGKCPKASCKLTIRACRPVELAKLKYWFCPECRKHYNGYNIHGVEGILNYWAYKAMCGFSYCVTPGTVPGHVVFGGTLPALLGTSRIRCELLALDKAWPHTVLETKAQWLRRLERARTVTLELARTWSSRRGRIQSNDEIRVQPGLASPMSTYPFPYVRDHVLSPITEASDSVGSTTKPPLRVKTISRETPQVHLRTLAKLCGEAPSGKPSSWLGEIQGAGSSTTTLVENPLDPWASTRRETADEKFHQASVGFTQPPSRQLTEQFNQPQRNIQPNSTGPDTSGLEPLSHGSGKVSESMRNDNVPRTDFAYWGHEVWEEDPTNTSSVEPAQGSLGKESERLQADDLTNSSSAEPIQKSPRRDPGDGILNYKAFAEVTLGEVNAREVTREQKHEHEKPNMTSRFSVSVCDEDEAAERATIASISPASEDEAFSFEDPETAIPVPETKEVQGGQLPEPSRSGLVAEIGNKHD